MPSDEPVATRFGDLLAEPLRNGIYKSKEHHGSGVKVVNMGELFGHPRLGNVPMKRLELTEAELRKSVLKQGDLLFARRSLVADGAGKCSIVKQVNEPTTFESSIIRARPDSRKVIGDYLYYYFASPQGRELMRTILRQVAVSGIASSDLAELQVPIPSLRIQRSSVDLLEALDDRIDLLRQINATLESIAQSLFKSWFIDFDPVRAKAEGREPEGMDAATAALFPAEFEESGFGPIPSGWKAGCIGDLADVIDCLHSKKPELLRQGRPYLQLSNIRDDGLLDTSSLSYVSDSDYEKWTSRIETREGDCVITNVGRVGAVAQIPTGFRAAMGRNMTAIRLRAGCSYPSFLIELLLSPWMRAEIERRTDVGTILNALNVRSIPTLQFVLSTHAVLSVAEQTLRPLRASMESNLARSVQLAKLRDTLLPRLMSGRLRVPEAKEQVEDALA